MTQSDRARAHVCAHCTNKECSNRNKKEIINFYPIQQSENVQKYMDMECLLCADKREREREIFDSHSLHVHTLLMLYALHCGLVEQKEKQQKNVEKIR